MTRLLYYPFYATPCVAGAGSSTDLVLVPDFDRFEMENPDVRVL